MNLEKILIFDIFRDAIQNDDVNEKVRFVFLFHTIYCSLDKKRFVFVYDLVSRWKWNIH